MVNGMKKVAIMYDFDKTLSTSDMQEYSLIPSLGYDDPKVFWEEVSAYSKKHKMDSILSYMFKVLEKSPDGFNYNKIKELGADVEFYDGVLDWFERINEYGKSRGLLVEHYIISSGMKEMIKGTAIAKYFKKIYACKYVYDEECNKAVWPAVVVNYTTKTQYIFRINKQVLDENDDKSVNDYVDQGLRPIPFRRMIYLGDGITDVPCMKLVKEYGGNSIALYNDENVKSKDIVQKLIDDNRANYMAKADYREGKRLDRIIKGILDNIKTTEVLLEMEGYDEEISE